MRILVVNTYVGAGAGGQERIALELALGLREAGHTVTIVGPYSRSSALIARLPREIELVEDPWRTAQNEGPLDLFRTVAHVIRRRRIDLVSGHGRMFGVYGACLANGVPLAWTLHGAGRPPCRGMLRWRGRLNRLLFRHMVQDRRVRFVAVSEFTRSCFEELLGRGVGDLMPVVQNGISVLGDLGQVEGPRLGPLLRLGFVGRLVANKGVHDIISAAEALAAKGMPFQWFVYGDGPHQQWLESAIQAGGLSDRVFLMGYEPEVCRIYSSFDILVHPALNDPLPTTVIEAFAAGRPVVGYASGGVSEMVQHQWNGMLAPANDFRKLADVLALLNHEPSRIAEMSGHARADARTRFSRQRMISDYLAVFQSMRRA